MRNLQFAISGLAAALLTIHLAWPAIRIDAIAVSLILIAILPWLSPLIKSVEVPGIGKVEFQELKDKVEEVQGAAQSALRKSEFASVEQSSSAANRKATSDSNTLANDKLLALAMEYNNTRQRMPSSDARTIAMTSILRQMADVSAEMSTYDIAAALRQTDGGHRLTAYAYLFVKPDCTQLTNLVHSLTTVEKAPFGQYWAIQALRKLLAACKNLSVDAQTLTKLTKFNETIQVDTDRHYELGRIVKDLNSSQTNPA